MNSMPMLSTGGTASEYHHVILLIGLVEKYSLIKKFYNLFAAWLQNQSKGVKYLSGPYLLLRCFCSLACHVVVATCYKLSTVYSACYGCRHGYLR